MGINADETRNAVTIGARSAEEVTDLLGRASTAAYCRDDETVQFMLVGKDDGLARGSDDWETTQEPGPDSGVVVLVTDRQTIFVVGECRDPEVDGDYVRRVKHADVDDVAVESSLLSSTFVLTTDDGVRLSITPTTTDGIGEVTRYVERASLRWSEAPAVFDSLDDEVEAIRESVVTGDLEDASRRKRSILQSLRSLGQTSSIHHVDLPALDVDRQRARERLANALGVGYWRRLERLVEEADAERERGDVDAAAVGYRQACEAFDAMTSNVDTGRNPFSDVDAAGELAPEHVGDALLGRLETCGERADDAADPTVALSAWVALLEGYEAVRSAVNLDPDAVNADPDEVHARLHRAARRTAGTTVDVAECFEERGDEAMAARDADEGREEYERAVSVLDQHRELAGRFDAAVDEDDAAAVRDRLADKIAQTQWEWGGSG